jgi:alkylation response protein AidB-like acyl-CoA dehydrogenase
MFLVDTHSPGITIRPIHTMSGYRTNEVYLEDVRVPRENLIGELNRGWYYAAGALDMERVTAFPVGALRATFERLVAAVKSMDAGGRRLKDDPLVRQKIGQMSIELEATQVLSYRAAWLVSRQIIPNYEASMLKLMSTESRQRMSNLATEIYGLYGQLGQGSPDAPVDGDVEWEYLHQVMPTFGGGANELQRDIIATRGMGLPRN